MTTRSTKPFWQSESWGKLGEARDSMPSEERRRVISVTKSSMSCKEKTVTSRSGMNENNKSKGK